MATLFKTVCLFSRYRVLPCTARIRPWFAVLHSSVLRSYWFVRAYEEVRYLTIGYFIHEPSYSLCTTQRNTIIILNYLLRQFTEGYGPLKPCAVVNDYVCSTWMSHIHQRNLLSVFIVLRYIKEFYYVCPGRTLHNHQEIERQKRFLIKSRHECPF